MSMLRLEVLYSYRTATSTVAWDLKAIEPHSVFPSSAVQAIMQLQSRRSVFRRFVPVANQLSVIILRNQSPGLRLQVDRRSTLRLRSM